MQKSERFLRKVKSKQASKTLTMNDIIDLAAESGIGLQEAFLCIKRELVQGRMSPYDVDGQVLKITNASHLKKEPSQEKIEFDKRVAEEVARLEPLFVQARQTYQERELRKSQQHSEQQQRKESGRTMSAELHAVLNPHLRLRKD